MLQMGPHFLPSLTSCEQETTVMAMRATAMWMDLLLKEKC